MWLSLLFLWCRRWVLLLQTLHLYFCKCQNYSCWSILETYHFHLFVSSWSGYRPPQSFRKRGNWISSRTWLAVSICYCVESSLTSVPTSWPWFHAHLHKWVASSQSSSQATLPVSATFVQLHGTQVSIIKVEQRCRERCDEETKYIHYIYITLVRKPVHLLASSNINK